jgi:hypothetical protein
MYFFYNVDNNKNNKHKTPTFKRLQILLYSTLTLIRAAI